MAAALVTLAHAGVWHGLAAVRDEPMPARAFKVIEAALLAPPPAPTPRPLPVVPPPPAPRKPPPPPRPEPARPQPAPLPLPVAAPAAPVAEPPPAPVVVTAPPAPEPPQPAAAQPPPAPASPPPAPAMVEAPRFNAAYLNNPPPSYPPAARRRGIEGKVIVRAEIQADGTCSRAELKQGSGHGLLDQAALDAVRKWRFIPARKGSQAVAAWVDVPITFKLEN